MSKKKSLQRASGNQQGNKSSRPGTPALAQSVREYAGAAERFLSRYRLPCEIIAVILLIATGFFFRMEDITDWKKNPARSFYQEQPLHTTFDAYFYLSLAKDLVDGTYRPIDEKRGVPDCPPRPNPPPLISVMAALITKVTHVQLSWVGAVLPALLGALLALPMYLLMRYYSGGLAGFAASLLSLMYPFYIYRSGLGRFDTDCLNITFILASAYLFLRFAIVASRKRYIYFALAVVNYALFLWWWDQVPAGVTAVTFLPFAVALAFYYRPPKKEGFIFAAIVVLAVLATASVTGIGIFNQIIKAIANQFFYISKEATGDFPNIGVTISEQSIPPLSTIIEYTTVTLPAFIIACAGIGLLAYRRLKDALFLGSIFILAALAFTYANRFIIFVVPALGIGSGYLLGEAWKLRNKFLPLYVICPALLLCFVLPLYRDNMQKAQYPKLTSHTAAGMAHAGQVTPGNAVIWAWWDNGYALTYFARRATINDGSIHSGDRTCYSALPLASTDYRMAANFMHFYAVRGMDGINEFYAAARMTKNEALLLLKSIFAAGPDGARSIIYNLYANRKFKFFTQKSWSTEDGFGWLPFLFPSEKRPVYLFLDSLLGRVTYWWYWFGTWNPDTRQGVHPQYQVFGGLRKRGSKITGPGGLAIDSTTGMMQLQDRSVQLSGLNIRTNRAIQEKRYTADSSYLFDFNEPGGYGALADRSIANSVFNNLYVRNGFNRTYFRPVDLRGSVTQLWEVIPDNYAPNKNGSDARSGQQAPQGDTPDL